MKSEAFNIDCMEGMADKPDKFWDLAIADPPFGIGELTQSESRTKYGKYWWNDSPPTAEYFTELRRVAGVRIIWGANYYNCFENGRGAIIWDKQNPHPTMSRCEIASVSQGQRITYFNYAWGGVNDGIVGRVRKDKAFHPCEKPVALYRWLLTNYAKPGDTILDTHLGSGSSRIAAYDLGFDFTGYELDADYFEAQEKRFARHIAQPKLFTPEASAVQENLFDG